MAQFHAGFAHELIDIMSKEAAHSPRHAKMRAALKNDDVMAAVKQLSGKGRHLAKGTLSGALFHKLVDPSVSTGGALKSGAGVAVGGAIGQSLAKQLGIRGGRGQLGAALVGSALGLRATRSGGKKKKSDRELLAMALKKESQQLVATATPPKRDALTGATPSYQKPPAPKSPSALGSLASKAKGLASNISSGAQQGLQSIKAKQDRAASDKASIAQLRGLGSKAKAPAAKPSSGMDFSKYPSLNKPTAAPATQGTQRSAKKPNFSSTGTTNARRFSSFMP